MEPEGAFHCEVENLPDDQKGNKVTEVKCHGRLVQGNSDKIKEVVKPLLVAGGRTIVDLRDLSFLDSSGLGALVGLKVSALHQGMCILEFVNMTPRILELLRITRLTQLFSS